MSFRASLLRVNEEILWKKLRDCPIRDIQKVRGICRFPLGSFAVSGAIAGYAQMTKVVPIVMHTTALGSCKALGFGPEIFSQIVLMLS